MDQSRQTPDGRLPCVLIAEADSRTRAGLRMALEADGFHVCAEAADARTAVEAAVRERPEVCVLASDIEGGAIDAVTQMDRAMPAPAIVMLSTSDDRDDLLRALRAGARGYLPKSMNPHGLPAALRGVMRGEAALPRALMGHVLDEFRLRENRRHAFAGHGASVTLTARECDVLDLLGDGLSTAEIAGRLTISAVTVRRHISAIMQRLGVPDRQAALDLLWGRPGARGVARGGQQA